MQDGAGNPDISDPERRLRVVSGVCTPHCLIDPQDYPEIHFTSCGADLRRRPVALRFDGELRFCNHSPVVMGNLHEQPLPQILASPYGRRWRDVVPGPCQGCDRFDSCRGGCRAASEQCGGTHEDVDPLLWPQARRRAMGAAATAAAATGSQRKAG